jgi:uncharacterized protein YbjT (DUF2867 family)
MKSNVLVIGGNGKTGRKVVKHLQNYDVNVRIGSRSATPAFDWLDSKTWGAALEGMDKVYITYQPDLAVPGALEAIKGLTAEAKKQGVKKLVLLSGIGEKEAQLSEQVVINSGLDFTIVQACWFMQNFSEGFFIEPILAGHVALPKADAKVPYISTDDIADVVVASLMNDEHNGKVYRLTGARQLTFVDIVQEISKEIDREIVFTPVSLDAYMNMLKEFNVPADLVWIINYLFTEVLGSEDNNRISNDVEKVLGRKPQDFSEYVKTTAASGAWNAPVKEAM